MLWFAVWLGWQYTCWTTNWFDPETPRIRGLLFTVMLLALVMACAIPGAFGERGLIFAGCYAAMQVGRTAFIVLELGASAMILTGRLRWLGALALAAFTLMATFLALRYWELPAGPARFGAANSFYEHLGLVGGFLLVAWLDLQKKH